MNSIVVHSISEKYRDFFDSFTESIDKIAEYVIKENPEINIETILSKTSVINSRGLISNIVCTIDNTNYIVEFKEPKPTDSAFAEIFDYPFKLYFYMNKVINKYRKNNSNSLSDNKDKRLCKIERKSKFIELNYGSTTK